MAFVVRLEKEAHYVLSETNEDWCVYQKHM
jgi:hypothetical protein